MIVSEPEVASEQWSGWGVGRGDHLFREGHMAGLVAVLGELFADLDTGEPEDDR